MKWCPLRNEFIWVDQAVTCTILLENKRKEHRWGHTSISSVAHFFHLINCPHEHSISISFSSRVDWCKDDVLHSKVSFMRQMTGDILSLGQELFVYQNPSNEHLQLNQFSSNRLDLKILAVQENDSGVYTCMLNDEKLSSFLLQILGKSSLHAARAWRQTRRGLNWKGHRLFLSKWVENE